jgi:hypothetical protein
MMGEEINSPVVTEKGLLGDRQFALIDSSTGNAASAKNPSKWPNLFNFRSFYTEAVESGLRIPPVRISLPHGRTILNGDAEVDTVLSKAIDKPVHLLWTIPVHLLSRAHPIRSRFDETTLLRLIDPNSRSERYSKAFGRVLRVTDMGYRPVSQQREAVTRGELRPLRQAAEVLAEVG